MELIYFLDLTEINTVSTDELNANMIKHKSIIGGLIIKENQKDLTNEPPKTILIQKEHDFFIKNDKVGLLKNIDTPDDMKEIMNLDFNNLKYFYIKTTDWHIIPLENLIAKFNKGKTELIAQASNIEEIKLLENVLELGVDICAIKIQKMKDFELLELVSEVENKLDLIELEVTNVEKIGTGDRVCVDTSAMLILGEGLLVGSTSKIFALVQAEVEESGFVNSRPFRINAGVVASYVLNGEKTNYLSELSAGSSVMIVNTNGNIRTETVARVKIERRPLIMVKVDFEGKDYPILLQDAETVKVLNLQESKRVDQLKKGDKILCYVSKSGRHFGMAINEFIEEK